MKIRIALITFISFLIASSGYGEYFIQWQNSQAALTIDGNLSNPITPNIGDQVLIELWFAGADDIIDSIVYDNNTTNNDDQLLTSAIHENTTNSNADKYGSYTEVFGGATEPFLGPSVYMRVYGSNTKFAGVKYLESPVRTVNDKDFSGTAPAPDVVDFNSGTLGLTGTVQAIPEPTTLAVIGMAMVVIYGMRRKIRR